MKRRSLATLLFLAALLSGCRQPADEASRPRVDAAAYDAFYLWPGVHPSSGLHPKTLYLLDGEIRRSGPVRLERLRMGTPNLPGEALWLVVRTDRLDWDEATFAAILNDLRQWQDIGNDVVGLQIDFDADTGGIESYARFLRDLRARLPNHLRLSVTGLMDWSTHGDPRALAKLGGILDEVVIQTYQGRTTIPGYVAYFRRMDNFPIPFRVALVDHGKWREPPSLKLQPLFQGYVVFLLQPKARH